MWTSVPQIPVLSTRTRTSLIPTSGVGTSSSHRPFSARLFTSAFMRVISFLVVLPCEDVYCPRKRPPGLLAVYQDLYDILTFAPQPSGNPNSRPGWRNWQTQRTQNPPTFGSWGFDPPSRHHR